jgi:glycerophosphoryl diester phosphodiesterase
MRRADPEIVTISLFNDEIHVGHDPLEIISEIGSRGINLSKDRVTPEIVERCHRHGFPVGVYTVNREAEMRRLIEMGVDSIFTDHPDRLIEVLRSAGPAVASGSD